MDRFRGLVSLICSLLLVGFSTGKRNDRFQVFTLTPTTPAHLELLRELQSQPNVQFWDEDIRLGRKVEVLAPGSIVHQLSQAPNAQSGDFQVTNEDIQAYIDDQISRMERRHNDPSVNNYDPNDYNTYEDILAQLVTLVNQCPSGFNCEYNVVGQTVEGRDIVVFKLSKPGQGRRSVWFDSLIHAREWLAGSTTMRVLEKLVTEYETDADVARLLDAFDFYVMPVHNADGYVYTWRGSMEERYWRKSRNENPGSTCIGTDLNRNFDIYWGGIGSSPEPCSINHRGPSAASEPETQAMQAELNRLRDEVFFALTIHTFGNYWLFPYGNTEANGCTLPTDYDDLQRVVDVACKAIEDTYNTRWSCGNICETLGIVNGPTVDYAKSIGIKYAYTPELRGPGFVPGPSEIQPSYEETWNGIVAAIDEIATIEGYNLRRK